MNQRNQFVNSRVSGHSRVRRRPRLTLISVAASLRAHAVQRDACRGRCAVRVSNWIVSWAACALLALLAGACGAKTGLRGPDVSVRDATDVVLRDVTDVADTCDP